MNRLAKVLQPGLQTTIQDAGRGGFRHFGVPQSGAADRLSLALANKAVGNHWSTAALECTLSGPTLHFERASTFAIAGADMRAHLNDQPVERYVAHKAQPGDVLKLGAAAISARGYIAFAGGVAGDAFLSSRSTYLPAGIGGNDGRVLKTGDTINQGAAPTSAPEIVPENLAPTFSHDWVLRACLGPEANEFDEKTVGGLFHKGFSADHRGDRIGVRLIDQDIKTKEAFSMNSSAVFPGTVQAPPDGAPFLLLADAQTTGGYPRIAQVIDADLNLAGQIRPGDRVWFRQVSTREARTISTQRLSFIRSLIDDFCFG